MACLDGQNLIVITVKASSINGSEMRMCFARQSEKAESVVKTAQF